MEPDEDDEEELRAEVDRLREACERHLEEAERQQRAADQANRRVEEQEKELGQLEDVVAGLEAQLREAQALGSRQGSELQAAKDQVASLERELGEEANSHSRRRIGRSKTEALKTASPEEAQQVETKREHEEAMKHRTELEKQARLFASLQDQHLQLQQYCVELKDAAHEIQGFLETAERENLQLKQEAEELRELLEVHHIKAMKGNVQVDFAEGESLAQELEDLDDPEAEEMSMNKTKSVQICEEPKPRRKPALRRSSSNVAASKLAALQEEYEEKFESQSQQLQSALLNKERIEREKQEAIESLQKQIEELKGKLPSESGGEALAGLFKMMSKIKELTTEASDAVLLGFAPAEPPAALPKATEPKAEALKFSSVAAASAVRNRLQRRQRKTVAGDSIDGDGGYQP